MAIRVLLLEDSGNDAEIITRELRLSFPDIEVKAVGCRSEFVAALDKSFDIALLDYALHDISGSEALRILKEKAPNIQAIIVTGTVGEEKVAECFRLGAVDFVNKDRRARLGKAIDNAVKKRQTDLTLIRAQRIQNIGALASGIAHDLNNCLSGPMIAVSMVMDELPPLSKQREILKKGQAGLVKAAELVRQIMAYLRGSNGGHQPVDLKRQIEKVVDMVKQSFPKSIDVGMVLCDLSLPVQGNATQIFQVLLNLCVNARDAMPSGGTVTVCLTEKGVLDFKPVSAFEPVTGHFAEITVSDTGIGIRPDIVSRIFEPFFTTKEPDKGTGLGLSTVLSIVEAHHGYIDVSSVVGMGTTFTILLPFTPEHKEEKAAYPSPTGRREVILVVDDEMTFLEIARALLEDANYEVLTACTGVDALDIYAERHAEIRVVISDLMMPIMDGPTLVNKMREIEPGVKVICLSGTDSTATVSMNADVSLAKPFIPSELLAELKRLMA